MTKAEVAKMLRIVADEVEAGGYGDHPAFLAHAHCMPITDPARGGMVVDHKLTGKTFVVSTLPGIPGVELAIRQLDPKPGQ